MAHDVFISHSSKDKAIADAACAALEQASIRCWIAPRDILPGESWGGAIIKAIESSRVMVVVFSAEANASKQVMREVERSVQKNVVVVPFRVEDIQPSGDMEYFLSATHWLDALQPPLDNSIRELVATVKQVMGREDEAEADASAAPAPTPAPPAAKPANKLGLIIGVSAAAVVLVLLVIAGALIRGCGKGGETVVAQTPPVDQPADTPLPHQPPPDEPEVKPPPPEDAVIVSLSDSVHPRERERVAAQQGLGDTADDTLKRLDLGDGMELALVPIPSGSFLMGDGGGGEDVALHEVRMNKRFMMSRYEITQGQFEAVLGRNPSKFEGDDLPVDSVSWQETDAFCKAVSFKTRYTVRLPTEAEWEYACRAGSNGPFGIGGELTAETANYDAREGGTDPTGDVYREKTLAVGSFKPNAWGLYDMHGNVWEWCQDWYAEDYYAKSDGKSDPDGPRQGEERVLRGGGWNSEADECRSWHRQRSKPELKKKGWNRALMNATRMRSDPAADPSTLGFRVVLELD